MGQKDRRIHARRLGIDPRSVVADVPLKIIDKPLQLNAEIKDGKVLLKFSHATNQIWLSPEEAVGVGVGLFQLGRKLKPELTPNAVVQAAQQPTNGPIWTPPDAKREG